MKTSSFTRRHMLAAAGGVALAPFSSFAAQGDIASALEAVSDARFVAIGELHDNPWHHENQAALVAALAPSGLAFEMIPRAHEATINALRKRGAARDEIAEAIGWADSGWPDWSHYAPILEAAPEAYIAGGGLSKDDIGAVYAAGPPGLGSEMTARYGLDVPLPAHIEAEMLDTQYEAHCGLVDRGKLGAMVSVQRAWDAAYAEAWRRAAVKGGAGAVLICGNAHARLDQGAPSYLSSALPEARIASVGQVETGDEREPGSVFTAILTAPRPERSDPCDAMRDAMSSKG